MAVNKTILTIIQALITLTLLAIIVHHQEHNIPVDDWLKAALSGVLGFWFGSRINSDKS